MPPCTPSPPPSPSPPLTVCALYWRNHQLVVGVVERRADQLALVGVRVRAAGHRAAAAEAEAGEVETRIFRVALGGRQTHRRPDVDQRQHRADLAGLHLHPTGNGTDLAERLAEAAERRALVVLVGHHDFGLQQEVGHHLLALAARATLARLVAAGTASLVADAALAGAALDDHEAVGLHDQHVEQRCRRAEPGPVVAVPVGVGVFLDAQHPERLVAVLHPLGGAARRAAGDGAPGLPAGRAAEQQQCRCTREQRPPHVGPDPSIHVAASASPRPAHEACTEALRPPRLLPATATDHSMRPPRNLRCRA